jgi:hypothetical protein
MSEDKKGEVIPLIKDKATRDLIKNQFDTARSKSLLNPTATKSRALQESLDRINRTMAEIKEMNRKSGEYLAKHAPEYAASRDGKDVVRSEPTVPPPPFPPETKSMLDSAELEREYRRKQDEAKKRRENSNRSVTRQYQLTRKDDNKK